MKSQWPLLFLRTHASVSSNIASRPLILHHRQVVSLSSLLHPDTAYPAAPSPSPSTPITHVHPRYFSTEPTAVDPSHSNHSLVIDTFSKPIAGDEIKRELESKNIIISHDLVLDVLRNVNSNPDVAVKFFDWVSETAGERLSSRSYNFMLGILGVNGRVERFWYMVDAMKKKGYGVHRGAVVKVSQKFEELKLDDDLKRLDGLFDYRKPEGSPEAVSSRIVKIIREEVWSGDVEKRIQELGGGAKFTSDLVRMVLENLETEPSKALIFFRWVEESSLWKHDEQTYNAMALTLGREDCIDRFWNIVAEMRESGYRIHVSVYVKVLSRFIKRKLMKDAVDLYEFVMTNGGETKPGIRDCILLLKKVAVGKEFDMELFCRTMKIAAESGSVLPHTAVQSVFKSLASVDRLNQFNKVMKAMRSVEVVRPPNAAAQGKVAFRLSKSGKDIEAKEFMRDLEESRCRPDPKAWVSMVEGYCQSGDLKQAVECFRKSIEKEGISNSSSGYALEVLVVAYCNRRMAVEVCKISTDLVKDGKVEPRHSTYKKLILELIHHGGFDQGLHLLGLMRGHGFPPFLDPFIEYVSKRGKANQALMFLQAMTSKKYPSNTVFIQVFQGYFKAGRKKEAQNLLAICPSYIRNHSDILNLFLSSAKLSQTSENKAAIVAGNKTTIVATA